MAYTNVKRVADYWTSGDGERARSLPPSEFNEILGLVLAIEEGKAIAAEEDAREAKRKSAQAEMKDLSLSG